MQSRWMSAIEAVVNTAVGYAISVTATMIILPLFGFDVDVKKAAGISAAFTVVSILRSYVVRRVFNNLN